MCLHALCADREGVEFVTLDNRPSEYEIMGCYPQQSKDTIQKFSCQIRRLVAETSLTKAPHRSLSSCLVSLDDLFKQTVVDYGTILYSWRLWTLISYNQIWAFNYSLCCCIALTFRMMSQWHHVLRLQMFDLSEVFKKEIIMLCGCQGHWMTMVNVSRFWNKRRLANVKSLHY